MVLRSAPIAAAFLALLATAGPGALASPVMAASSAPVAAGPAGASWTTYHHDDGHTGYDPLAPAISTVVPTPGWTESPLDGEVYAEPLVYNGFVYVATLNNTVYAINVATGVPAWSKHLGSPQSSGWVCGNVAPMGILGTPVIDAAANRIYAVAEIAGATPTYRLFGLDLGSSGNIVLNTSIAPTGFDWKIQQERGALALANGYVYVPFGGRAGDCFDGATPYYGWVAGVPTDGISPVNVFRTPSGAESVWSAGGVVVDDSTHNIFFATGNAIPCAGSTFSDAIVRVSPTLTSASYFEPSDWQANWCGPDLDLGSASPLLISPNLIFTAGKHGGGFLLDPANLGGIDGQLFPARTPYQQADVCLGNHNGATFGSFAYAAPFVYVECEGRGLVALDVNTTTPAFNPCDASCASPDWHAGGTTTFGPPIVAGGAVWVASDGGGLYAFNASNGAAIFHSAGFGINRFVTPAEAGGQVFVPSHTVVKSFTFGSGPVTFTPSQLDFHGQPPGTTSAAQTVTLHNNQNVTLNVATAAVTGANSSSFAKGSDTCTAHAVASGGTCTVQVSFKPGTYGAFPASLTFTDDGPGSPQSVSLNGLGAVDNQLHLYTLDGWGGLHADGSAPAFGAAAYWPGWNIARSVSLFPDGMGGYVMDGYGGLHPFGNAPGVGGYSYWAGWDIARQVVLAPWSSSASPAGWTLDGWGGIHPFGGAPTLSGYAYWAGWDIARGLVILPDSTPGSVGGYTLDGYGGLHPFGAAPTVSNFSYWGWDIGRAVALSPDSSRTNVSGWTLDGWGGVHPFGGAPTVSGAPYWPGFDIARGLISWNLSASGGWVLDGYGGLHPFGDAAAISSYPYWAGWDIATGVGGPNSNSGSRRRT